MNDRFLSVLGLARRAGKLAVGHDAVKRAVVSNKAYLVLFSADASDRLKTEIRRLAGGGEREAKTVEINYNMEDIQKGIGKRAAVLALNDKGLSELALKENRMED